jgi:hypothetical protein
MAQQNLDFGTGVPNSGTGEPLLPAMQSVQANFTDLYNQTAANAAAISAASAVGTANTASIAAIQASLLSGILVNSTAAATINTTLIQSALTAGGLINLTQTGTVYINTTLLYSSFTRLILGPSTIVRLAPGSNCTMLNSTSAVAFLAGGTPVTLTQGARCAVNVQWTAHGRTVGQGVWLSGSTPSTYNGVFRVAAVSDANNFTIYTTQFGATAPSGAAKAVVAVQEFQLIGGVWNYDFPNNPTPGASFEAHGIGFYGLIDGYAESVNVQSTEKFNFCVCAVNNLRLKNMKVGPTLSDGIKIYGPSRDVYLDGLYGTTGDDFCSVQTKEPAAFISYQISGGGDCFNINVKNITGAPGGSGAPFHLYPSDNEVTDMILVENVDAVNSTGSQTPVTIGSVTGSGYTVNQIGQVTLRSINNNSGNNIQISNATISQLIIEELPVIYGSTNISSNTTFLTSAGSSVVTELILKGLKSSGNPTAGAGATSVVAFGAGGTFSKIICKDCVIEKGFAASSISLMTFFGACTVGDFVFEDCYLDAASSKFLLAFSTAPSAGNTTITVSGCSILGSGCIDTGGLLTGQVKLRGSTFSAQSLGLLRTSGGACVIALSSDGTNDFHSTLLFAVTAGTLALTCYGNDLSVDAGLLATTKGQYFSHASAVAGRNAANQQGPCIAADGTHFYALATGASGVNTLIL